MFVFRFLKEEWNCLKENVSSTECPLRETVWKNFPRKIEKKTIEVIPCSLRNVCFVKEYWRGGP
jgi:ubiquitin-like-specific protease 1C/D